MPPSTPVSTPLSSPLSSIEQQPRAVATLRAALAQGKLHHAYLFAGPSGVGKETTARAFTEALTCPIKPGIGCGECSSCGRVRRGNHPDVHLLVSEAEQVARGLAGRSDFGRTPSRDLRIDQVRVLQEHLARRPLEAPVKVAWVFGADALNAAAQNAFLRTLEEPPPDTVLILVTAAPHVLLPTLRSRMMRIPFGPLPEAWLAEKLIAGGAASANAAGEARARAEWVAHVSQGSWGAALALDEEALVARETVVRAFEALRPGDVRPLLRFAEEYAPSRDEAEYALRSLLSWNGDVAAWESSANRAGSPAGLGSLGGLAEEVARREVPARLQKRHQLIAKALQAIDEYNASPRLQVESLLLELLA